MNIFTNRDHLINYDEIDLLNKSVDQIYSARQKLYEDLPKPRPSRLLFSRKDFREVFSNDDLTYENTRYQPNYISFDLMFLND